MLPAGGPNGSHTTRIREEARNEKTQLLVNGPCGPATAGNVASNLYADKTSEAQMDGGKVSQHISEG